MNETIAAELFDGLTHPWEALPKIGEFIKKLGETLDPEEYDKVKHFVERYQGIEGTHDLIIHNYGPNQVWHPFMRKCQTTRILRKPMTDRSDRTGCGG